MKLLLVFLGICQPFFAYNDINMKYKLDFYTQFNQFYLTSDGGAALTHNSLNWSDTAYNDRLDMLKNMLVIFSGSYGHIKGELYILDHSNTDFDYSQYEHIVEGEINVQSGGLEILDCPNSALELKVKIKPGHYRVRVYSSNLSSSDIDEDEGNDHYRIEIWPDNNVGRKVLKRYTPK